MNNVQKTLSAALVIILATTAAVNAQMSPEELQEIIEEIRSLVREASPVRRL